MPLLEELLHLLSPWVTLHQPIAVAVSGGADSLALTLLVAEGLRRQSLSLSDLHAVTIDHRLRPESSSEAETVHSWLSGRGIHHTTLVWNHEPLTSGVEAKARTARYQLLTAYCRDQNIPFLMTAHHALDQLETFFMHLSRGSSLLGLCGIRPCMDLQGITIIRPFLSTFPETLKTILEDHFHQEYLTDPSNLSHKFERVQWRYLLKNTPLLSNASPSLLRTINHFNDLSQQLDEAANIFLSQHCLPFKDGFAFDKAPWLQLLPAVGERVLKQLIDQVATTNRPWPHSTLERLYAKVRCPTFKGATAHHCVLRAAHRGRVSVVKEHRPRYP